MTGTQGQRRGELSGALWVLLLVALLFVYRLWVIRTADLTLDVEETYYLFWSLNPDLGYYSKPPMIAWLLAASTTLFGPGVFGVKVVALLLHSATALLIYSLGHRLYGERVGIIAALAFLTIPIMGVMALYTTTDAPLHFFWALTLRLFVQARDSGRLHWWLLTGVAAGLGLLSKYTMGLLAIGLLLYLLCDRKYRPLLWSPGLWLGVLAAALVWLPNLWWNLEHDFISFRHTAQISQLQGDLFHIDKLLEFLLPQLLMFGPVFFITLGILLLRPGRVTDSNDRLLFWVSVVPLLVISLQALLAEANLNWASPAYVAGSLLVSAYLARTAPRWLAVGIIINSLVLVGVYHYHAIAGMLGVELGRDSTPYRKRLGWRELGAQLQQLRARYPHAVLLSDERELLAYMGYYSGKWPPSVASWNPSGEIHSQYDLLADIKDHPAGRFLFISRHPLPASVLSRFRHHRDLGELRYQVYPDLSRSIHVYLLEDFEGYR